MGKPTRSPSRNAAKKPNTGSPGTCVTCGGTGTVLAPKGAPASRPSLCADCGGTGKVAAGNPSADGFVPGQLQTPEPLTDPRTIFRALLSRDFRVKGSVVLFPGGLSATLEVVVQSVAEVTARLEGRLVSLERLVEVTAANLYPEVQQARLLAGKEPGPTFDAWWDVLKASVAY